MFEFAAAGAVLLHDEAHRGGGDEAAGVGVVIHDDTHRGGGCVCEASGELAERAYSDEEVSAVRWECPHPEDISRGCHNVLRGLPEWCIKQRVEVYQSRVATTKAIDSTPLPPLRDARLQDWRKAGKQW